MKKMKKVIILGALILLAVCSVTAQNESIGKDPLFIENLSVSNSMVNEILESKDLDLNAASIAIKNLDKKLNPEEQIAAINKILMLKDENSFSNYYYTVKENWVNLKEKYGINEKEIKAGIDAFYSLGQNRPKACQDPSTYAACVLVVGTTAQLGYAGCVGTLFAAPACFAIVLIGQTAGVKICHTEWCAPH
jgi:hypothetical protein